MRRNLLAGNWKMNMTSEEMPAFFDTFVGNLQKSLSLPTDKIDILFAPVSTVLVKAKEAADRYGIRIASQNVHWEKGGAGFPVIGKPAVLTVLRP